MKDSVLKENKDFSIKFVLAVSLITFAVMLRLMPHAPNFAAIAAIAIFGGGILPRRWALSLPLAAMIVSDFFIGFHSLFWVTWGSFLLIALLSSKYMNKIRPASVVGASLGASILFFLVTNFGVWLEGRLYPLTYEGLISSYYNAIPFFRNTLISDLAFSTLLFGSYVLIYRYVLKGKQGLQVAAKSPAVR